MKKIIFPDGTIKDVDPNIAFGLIDKGKAKLYRGEDKMMRSDHVEEIVPYKLEPKAKKRKKKGYKTKKWQ